MAFIRNRKDRELAPAGEVADYTRKHTKEDSKRVPGPIVQTSPFQGRRSVTLTSERTQGINSSRKLIVDDLGNAYFVDEAQPKAQRVLSQDTVDLRFPERLIHHFFDESFPDRETHTDTDCGKRLTHTVSTAIVTAGARRSRRASRSPSRTKRDMSSPPLPPGKRRRSSCLYGHVPETSDDDSGESELDETSNDSKHSDIKLQSIRPSEIFVKYYIKALSGLGQLACRELATTWIKWCHPKKQVRYPYKGRDRTQPNYWPSSDHWKAGLGCRHIEPAHLRKSERLFLLRHLLCYGGQFSIEKLEESTKKFSVIGTSHWTTARFAALQDIYRLRRREIEFEERGSDGNCKIYLSIPIPREVRARNAPKSINTCLINSERAHRDTKKPKSLSAATTRKRIGTPEEIDMGVDPTDWEEMSEAELTVIEKASSSINIPTANDECAPQLEALMPPTTVPAERRQIQAKFGMHPGNHPYLPPGRQRTLRNVTANQQGGLPVDSHSQIASRKPSMVHAKEIPFDRTIGAYQEKTSSALPFWAVSKSLDTSGLGNIRQGYSVPNQRLHREAYIQGGTGPTDHPTSLTAAEIQQHAPPLYSPVPRESRLGGSSSGLVGLDSYWHTPTSIQSGTSSQEFNVYPYSYWNLTTASAKASSSSDCTNNSGTSFGSGSLQGPWNQSQDDASKDQYSAFIAPDSDTFSVNPACLMNSSNFMGGNFNFDGSGP